MGPQGYDWSSEYSVRVQIMRLWEQVSIQQQVHFHSQRGDGSGRRRNVKLHNTQILNGQCDIFVNPFN